MAKLPPTEQSGKHESLHSMSVGNLVNAMNSIDNEAVEAVSKCKWQVEEFINALVPRMRKGGRLFYVGAGTSGRLGVVDASECPPTFGVEYGTVVGLIAGGDSAIRKAMEGAEDSTTQGWEDLKRNNICKNDCVVGIAASGRTPYVIGALKEARARCILTGAITCNPETEAARNSDHPMEAITGPEFITGSTRLKAGTATKLILNMITTIAFIQLGHVKGNRMIDMQLSNVKLVERGTRMVAESTGVSTEVAKEMLLKHGSVRNAVESINNKCIP